MAVPIDLKIPSLVPSVLDDLLVNESEEFAHPVWRDVPTRIADAQPPNAQLHRSLVDGFDILGFGTGGVFGDKHHRYIVFNGIRDGFFHR